MAASKNTTTVAKIKEAELPAEFLDELMGDSDKFEQPMGKDDMSIPFMQILQSLSPQCTRGHAEYIKGAEPSMLFNTVTKELIPTRDDDDNAVKPPIRILSITYRRSFIEWVPRAQGGGFVQEHDVATGLAIPTMRNDNNLDIIQKVGEGQKQVGKPGNQLNDTHTHFVFIIRPDGTYAPAVLTMTSTQIKPSKDWNYAIGEVKLPNGAPAKQRFFALWDVTTRLRTNDQGSWYVWEFSRNGSVIDLERGVEVYREARKFAEGVEAGEHKVDLSKMDGEVNPATPSTGGEGGDDEMPF